MVHEALPARAAMHCVRRGRGARDADTCEEACPRTSAGRRDRRADDDEVPPVERRRLRRARVVELGPVGEGLV